MKYRWVFNKGLPRAKIVTVERQKVSWYSPINGRFPRRRWAYFRMANAGQLRFGKWCVTWRMPWLDEPARQTHAHLFSQKDSRLS